MKDLEWREDMSVEEKLEDGFKLMVRTFKEVFRKMDLMQGEVKELRQTTGRQFLEMRHRFDKMDERFDLAEVHNEKRFEQLESAILMVGAHCRRTDERVETIEKFAKHL